jgi:hypothetical protein
MSNPAQVTILAEDRRQSRLVRAYLRRRLPDLPQRNVKDAPMAGGAGSGAQWVTNRYAIEIRAYCARQAHKWLIVVIDADSKSIQDRLLELHRRLEEADDRRLREFRVETEKIARLVPKWSVETWILNLNGEIVEEGLSYKREHRRWDELIQSASSELSDWARAKGKPPVRCTPSLVHGIQELRRLSLLNI